MRWKQRWMSGWPDSGHVGYRMLLGECRGRVGRESGRRTVLFPARYVPGKMVAYGVSRPQLMPYDVQWRATYFLSINLPFAPTAF